MKIVRNTAIDQYRRNNKQNEWLSEQGKCGEETSTFIKSVEDREFLQQLLQAVPTEYREIIKLRCYYGFSAKETGNILGISEGNVNKRLERARKLITDRLEWEEEFGNETGKKVRSDNGKLGQEIEEEQFWKEEQIHDFSKDYQNKKQRLLSLAETNREKKTMFHNYVIRRILQAVAAVIIVVGISFTVYAMTKNGEAIQVEIEKGAQTIFVEVERKKECADVIAVPEYLPEGYEVWDEEKEKYSLGKYSFGGVWGANGITILVDEWMEKEQFPYKTCEIWQTGNVKKLLIDRGEESGYRWGLLQFYEKEGYVVQMFAASFIPKEEVLEIGKQIKIYEKDDFYEREKEKSINKKVTLGEKIEYPNYAKGCSLQVTDIVFSEVEDEVHKIDGPVKKMEVTVKLQNTTDKLWEELPVYPVFYSPLMENEPPYDLKGGVSDSKYNGKYYVRLEPHSEKEVYFTFIVAEEGLEEGYLEFFGKDNLKLFE